MKRVKTYELCQGSRAPLVFEPIGNDRDLSSFVAENRNSLNDRLLEHGGLLFRGFDVRSEDNFDGFIGALTDRRMGYVYGTTPRSVLGRNIFSSTDYPPQLDIDLHNECSYQRQWPLKIAFSCLLPALDGGETPIADMRTVTRAIGNELMDKFESKKVRYVRHYHPYVDVPWQKVFQTSDKEEVARNCTARDIQHEWLDEQILRTVQVSQGTALHPLTEERVFFNQAHHFHVSTLGVEPAKALIDFFGINRLPKHGYYADGTEIPAEDLHVVRQAFRQAAVSFSWKAGDTLLLDNMQFAHGRRPFKGPRKVIAALLDPS